MYPLKESKRGEDHYGLLLFTPWHSETNSEQQERNKQQGQNGPRVKMGFCPLPPDRVKLAVNSKKKQTAGSKWAKGQDGLLLFTPWKSQNELLLFTPWQSQTNWTARKKQRVGSNWAKKSQVGPGPFDSESNRAKKSRWVGTSTYHFITPQGLAGKTYEIDRLSNTFKKFYNRHTDLVGQYQKNVYQMFADSIKLAKMTGVMHETDHAYAIQNTWWLHRLATNVPYIACVIKFPLSICLLLVCFVSAAGCHYFDSWIWTQWTFQVPQQSEQVSE